jgi:hypothetical protein
LDWAFSSSLGVNFINDSETVNADVGLLSKVYFPIRRKNLNISPYIGGGISRVYQYAEVGDDFIMENYWNAMLLLGISWYVGPGSVDLGLQYGKTVSVTLGYTFSLSR